MEEENKDIINFVIGIASVLIFSVLMSFIVFGLSLCCTHQEIDQRYYRGAIDISSDNVN